MNIVGYMRTLNVGAIFVVINGLQYQTIYYVGMDVLIVLKKKAKTAKDIACPPLSEHILP